MDKLKNRINWTSIGCAVALLVGSPTVFADDTELLLYSLDPALHKMPECESRCICDSHSGILRSWPGTADTLIR